MANYLLSEKADHDIESIFEYSWHNFGSQKAEAYIQGLSECLSMLANNPKTGQRIDQIRQGYFRFIHASHTIYYKSHDEGVLIIRILHHSMKHDAHL